MIDAIRAAIPVPVTYSVEFLGGDEVWRPDSKVPGTYDSLKEAREAIRKQWPDLTPSGADKWCRVVDSKGNVAWTWTDDAPPAPPRPRTYEEMCKDAIKAREETERADEQAVLDCITDLYFPKRK